MLCQTKLCSIPNKQLFFCSNNPLNRCISASTPPPLFTTAPKKVNTTPKKVNTTPKQGDTTPNCDNTTHERL